MGIQDVPRRYRVTGWKAARTLTFFGASVLGFLTLTWGLPEFVSDQVKAAASALMVLLFAGVAFSLPRSGTSIDGDGIELRGPLRTRRFAWAEVQDIRTEPLTSGASHIPETVAYAYLARGGRKLLIHLNDLYVPDFEQEIAIVRMICAERRGGGDAPVV
ncbi:PH domain-containing protein [Streptomyces sp. NPDC006529]|uniref:PH domain-containing protein n=1 Tax=Streptomyces sp. NPDC006529 TaxID=3157177 RepID=UPI0033B6AD5B